MRILVDCDGVLADLCGAVCALLPGRIPADFRQHDFDLTLTKAELETVRAWSDSPGVIKNLPWYPSAKVFIQILGDLGTVFCVTAPWTSPTWDKERRAWLAPFVPWNRVITCPSVAKQIVSGDVLIEDRLDTLEAWCDENPNGHGIVIDRPWNRGALPSRVQRAYNYLDAIRAVRRVAPVRRVAS